MLAVLMDFPSQCRHAQMITDSFKIPHRLGGFDNIVFCGVGGSANGADLVRSYLCFESKIPISVVKEYRIPAFVNEKTLLFILSYSGNTEEAISCYQQSRSSGAFVVAVSSNGQLKTRALEDGVSFIEIPRGLPPRYALGFLSIVPLCVLSKLGLAKDVKSSLDEIVQVLEDLRDKSLNARIGIGDNIAKYIAGKLFNKFPAVYSNSMHFEVAAIRFKNELNENSKILAMAGVFPDMNHNEIMGWQGANKTIKNFSAVMLRDKLDTRPEIVKRIELTEEILKKEGFPVLEIWSRGQTLLARIFSLIYICDFVSFYLAIMNGADPAACDRIDFIKKKLSA